LLRRRLASGMLAVMIDMNMATTLRENIQRLKERDEREAREAPLGDRLADAITRFAGSMRFVALHALLFGSWIVWNLGWIPGLKPFDPTFVVLAMEASVEAIFLSTFVLISQNRMAAAADRRGDLDLHISLLAEHELTRLAGMIEQIAERVGARSDPEIGEIKKDVSPEQVLDALDDKPDA
jgi:uncharacterized membrane protein